jgi:Mpv17 / PMP22 family
MHSTNGHRKTYLKQLQTNPLRTKMLTSGSLAALQEVLASWLAHDRSKHGHYFSSRVPKMAAYGALISAPLGHLLINMLQKLFANRTSLKAKILQILLSNLIVSLTLLLKGFFTDVYQIAPIQNTVYLASMAVIAGARTWHQVRATVRAGFMPVMKVSWITSPLALAFAQKFLPEQTWVPFFNIIAFVIGTYINTHTKKKRLAALRKKVSRLPSHSATTKQLISMLQHYGDGKSSSGRDDYPRPNY